MTFSIAISAAPLSMKGMPALRAPAASTRSHSKAPSAIEPISEMPNGAL